VTTPVGSGAWAGVSRPWRRRQRVIERWVRTATAGASCAPYRSHTAFMDLIADQYDANDSALRRTVEHIKDALDPAGILAPTSGASGRPAALTAPT
jgi:hypothetical protein